MPTPTASGPPQSAVTQRRFSRSPCACGGSCPTCSAEQNPLGARAARDGDVAPVADEAAPAAEPAAAPAFRDCTEGITGITDANERLETARQRAREFVGAARRALGAAPAAGTTYATALGRHFIAPTDANRATIEDTYRQILGTLVPRNYICNSQNICGTEQAFWIESDDLVHVCRPFWELSPTCRAIILIHEGAHDVGIGVAGAHPPNRGDAQYPAGNVAPPAGETTAGRMDNPDAYAFFGAHIWRDTDTGRTCF
ncbi:M35 family metallopeptidase [Metapseudomonas boanensis]|uniref:Lysine-specific metallo-endopeptidase domain-containing protein n=1 Tax=Metapseudomonas boanensis TaxID=2822138 RepID=A0ABS5XN14_9GAMM|nr:M35 family metallopeptidase [Pseudomonas boanensis]MBT8768516.1 hypothetical protein [Pseudomonas boanensis]